MQRLPIQLIPTQLLLLLCQSKRIGISFLPAFRTPDSALAVMAPSSIAGNAAQRVDVMSYFSTSCAFLIDPSTHSALVNALARSSTAAFFLFAPSEAPIFAEPLRRASFHHLTRFSQFPLTVKVCSSSTLTIFALRFPEQDKIKQVVWDVLYNSRSGVSSEFGDRGDRDGGWSLAMAVLDAMEKSANVGLVQTELNDAPGVCLKLHGSVGDVQIAVEAARQMASLLETTIVAEAVARPAPGLAAAFLAQPDFNPLIEQPTVRNPEKVMNNQSHFAVGLIETQGFTAVFEAVDTALKTAAVEVVAREKLGGGYITVVIKGDVAAVRAAIDAAKAKVEGLGRLIAAHVIPSPSEGVLSLLPK